MSRPIFIVLVIILIISLLAMAKDLIARVILSRTLYHLTGLRLSIQELGVELLRTCIDIRNLKLYNPQGYPDKIMAELPQIYIDFNPGAFNKGEIHLPEVRIHLKELNIVKNAEGYLNLSFIKAVREQKQQKSEEELKKWPVRIDSLQLKIGRVTYLDYHKAIPPLTEEFALNLDERYANITDLRTLINIIVIKAMKKTAIDRLANFDLSIITEHLPPGLKEGAGMVTETAAEVKKAAGESLGQATKTIKETTTTLTGMFHFPVTEKEQ